MKFFNWFKHHKNNKVINLISVNGMDISTGHIGGYLLNLKETVHCFKDAHLGYFISKNENYRFVIYGIYPNKQQIEYFTDRCPAMIEEDIKSSEPRLHNWILYYDKGFDEDLKEIVPY